MTQWNQDTAYISLNAIQAMASFRTPEVRTPLAIRTHPLRACIISPLKSGHLSNQNTFYGPLETSLEIRVWEPLVTWNKENLTKQIGHSMLRFKWSPVKHFSKIINPFHSCSLYRQWPAIMRPPPYPPQLPNRRHCLRPTLSQDVHPSLPRLPFALNKKQLISLTYLTHTGRTHSQRL